MILEFKNCQLRFTKAGVYLVLFTIGLASSSHVTGSNILLLLNFLLISVIIFNFIYLKRLASNSIELKLMSIIEEDFGPALEIKDKIILPLSGKIIFTWERFDQRIQTTLNILRFSNKWFIKGDSITLRGTYNLEHILLEIEFPFPLFKLRGNYKIPFKLLVFPKDNHSKYSDENHQSYANNNKNSFSHFRDYLAGDSMNLVSWKELARTNKLLTKVFESNATKSQQYSISYNSRNEKEVFHNALNFFKLKMKSGQPYKIIGKYGTFVFNGDQIHLNKLHIFLAKYQQPSELNVPNVVLGEFDVT